MGKKVYTSGAMPSDLARPQSAGMPLDVLHQPLGPPTADDTARIKAACYVRHETDRDELWDALGLGDVIDGRRRALGLPVPEPDRSPACPTCGAASEVPCRSAGGGKLKNWHLSRRRLADG